MRRLALIASCLALPTLLACANAAGHASLWLGPQAVRVLIVDTGAKKVARKSGKAQPKKAKPSKQPSKKPSKKSSTAAQPRKKPPAR